MATQKGRNWSSGDIVTAANLSSIERGVSAVAEEYTPTTWANGDTVTAAALNNIEQGIVNAGGGSSDFSIATVTFGGYGEDPVVMHGALATLVQVQGEDDGIYISVPSGDFASGDECQLILYKGRAYIIIETEATLTVSGNITSEGEVGAYEYGYIVTGDCTITIGDRRYD